MQAEEQEPIELEEYQLSTVKIDDLIFDKSNPNRPSKEVIEGIRKSILEFGLIKPLVINEKMEIADGEHRALVWKALGKTDIQAYIVPRLNDDIKRRLARQTLNKLQGEHDIKLDADEMALIFEAGQLNNLAELIAQERESLENILTKHKGIQFQHEDNFDVDKALEDLVPETQLGDIWQLGSHRIACGDCSDNRIIEKLMEGKKADMVFTDPPYGIDYQNHLNIRYEKIKNDALNDKDITDLLKTSLKQCPDTGFVSCNWKSYSVFYETLKEIGKEPKACIVWDKQRGVQNIDRYFKQHEFLIYFGPFGNQETRRGDVWSLPRQNTTYHPGEKPISLISMALQDASNEDQIIFDPFLGSGSTLIACEQTNRICYGVEIDPHYCDVVVKRWEAYTGAKANLIRGESVIGN